MYKYNCSILVFLELHTDSGSSRAILENLNLLKNLGYLTYLLEEPDDLDFAETYYRMEATGNEYLNIVKSSILQHMKGIPEEQISRILEIGNKDIAIGSSMEGIMDQYYSIKDSYAATLSLMSKVNKDADLSIHNIDMPSKQKERMEINSDEFISLRDAYFSQKINKLCLEGHTKQVFLVGAAHGPGVKKILALLCHIQINSTKFAKNIKNALKNFQFGIAKRWLSLYSYQCFLNNRCCIALPYPTAL